MDSMMMSGAQCDQVLVSQAEFLHGARREVLCHHVRNGDQVSHNLPALFRAQVKGAAQLVTLVQVEKPGPVYPRDVVGEGRPLPVPQA